MLPVSRRELHFWEGILKQSTKMHSAEALLRNIPTRGRGRGSPAEEFKGRPHREELLAAGVSRVEVKHTEDKFLHQLRWHLKVLRSYLWHRRSIIKVLALRIPAAARNLCIPAARNL